MFSCYYGDNGVAAGKSICLFKQQQKAEAAWKLTTIKENLTSESNFMILWDKMFAKFLDNDNDDRVALQYSQLWVQYGIIMLEVLKTCACS